MKVLKTLFFLALFFGGVVGAYFFGTNTTKIKYQKQVSDLKFKLEPTKFVLPDYYSQINKKGWLSYNNKMLGISFEYPPGYILSNRDSFVGGKGDCNLTIAKYVDVPLGSENDQIFFSVVPKNQKIKCQGDNWPYKKENLDLFNQLKVGQNKSTAEGSSTSDYFSFTRLSDQGIAGLKMKVFYTDKVWEFAQGTKEYVYVYESKNAIYYLGGFVDSDITSGRTIPFETFKQIFASLKIDLKE